MHLKLRSERRRSDRTPGLYTRLALAATSLVLLCGGSVSAQTQSCCFPDGTCQDLPPGVCTNAGGRPGGVGSNCATTECYKNWVIADDFRLTDTASLPVTRVR